MVFCSDFSQPDVLVWNGVPTRQSWYLTFVPVVQPLSWPTTTPPAYGRDTKVSCARRKRVHELEQYRAAWVGPARYGGRPDIHILEATDRLEGTTVPQTARRPALNPQFLMLMACLFFRGFCDSHREKCEGTFAQKTSPQICSCWPHCWPIIGPILALVPGRRFCTQTNETPPTILISLKMYMQRALVSHGSRRTGQSSTSLWWQTAPCQVDMKTSLASLRT